MAILGYKLEPILIKDKMGDMENIIGIEIWKGMSVDKSFDG